MLETLNVKMDDIKSSGGAFTGYGAIFEQMDQGGDVIRPGAFAASLARHKAAGTLPAMLYQHDPNRPIGVWTKMEEDARGLMVEGRLVMEAPDGKATAALLEAGALRGLSIGYKTTRASSSGQGGRYLEEIDLWEVSMVTFPMQPSAQVDQKSIDACATIRDCEQALRSMGLSQRAATGMVGRIKAINDADRDGRDAADRIKRALDGMRAA